jgi:ACR3 family arsenite transporter
LRSRSLGADRRQQLLRLAVAVAISQFGFESGAALAAVVGVLIKAPVMLNVVWIVNRSRGW